MSATERSTAEDRQGWWAVAAVLLAGALAVVVVWIGATRSGADWFDDQPSITIPGSVFNLSRGTGHRQDSSFLLERAAGGTAALSATISPFPAENYPRIEWNLHSAVSPDELAFVWWTREHPDRSFSKPLHWLVESTAPLDLAADDGWQGTITGIALVTRGALRAPLEIAGVRLPSASLRATVDETFAQWAAFYPLKGYAVAFPFDAERFDYMPLARAVAIAVGLALLAYVFFMRRRKSSPDARVLWAIFAGGWLLLDARWEVNLWHETALAAGRFAGKNTEEKQLAARDAPLFELAQEIKRALPEHSARIFVLSDNDVIAVRLAYLLYPYNAYHHPVKRGPGTRMPAPDRSALHSGDYVVLAFYSLLGYDAAKGNLVWPGGATLPAEAVVSKSGMLLVRIR